MKGLIAKHSYSVISVHVFHQTRLVKVRNPHGKGVWTGDWCTTSIKWAKPGYWELTDALNDKDGEFFISFQDYLE